MSYKLTLKKTHRGHYVYYRFCFKVTEVSVIFFAGLMTHGYL